MLNLKSIIEEVTGYHLVGMHRQRPYDGQPWTCNGQRGEAEVKGITFRDLQDCYIRAIFMSASHIAPELYEESLKGELAAICPDDVYRLDFNQLDPIAIAQNLSCEVERIMNIFPNIEKEKE